VGEHRHPLIVVLPQILHGRVANHGGE
jgi:hypothetical protein